MRTRVVRRSPLGTRWGGAVPVGRAPAEIGHAFELEIRELTDRRHFVLVSASRFGVEIVVEVLVCTETIVLHTVSIDDHPFFALGLVLPLDVDTITEASMICSL